VDTDSQFGAPLIDSDTLTVTYYELSGLQYFTKYYWHVSAINDSGETAYSKLGHFTTKILPPEDAPVLLEPANDTTGLTLTVVHKWTAVTYATSYEVQVSLENDFSGVLVVNDTMNYATEKILPGLEYETKYYWKVRAKNASGKGPWSEINSYTTKEYVSVNDEAFIKYNLQAYPNPFNESTLLSFTLPQPENVIINVYNLAGAQIETLLEKELPEGEHHIKWLPANLESGKYFYSIQIGELRLLKEITFIK